MYFDFYGLKTSPFNITCDPRYFFESTAHREALAALIYGIQEKRGIILITGEVGTGKTTLCRALLNRLSPQVKTSFILNPQFSDVQLLQAIIEDFGINSEKKSRLDMVRKLNTFLLENNLAGGNAVIIIDEAQNLSSRQLEQVRLLSNLETASEKLLQIVLVGQPELCGKLNQVDLRQIRQRIFVKYNLAPLNESEVKNYVEFRLAQSGANEIKVSADSFKLIYEFSAGIPRMVNMLFDRVLLYGFAKEKKVFNEDIFRACIDELR